ncbi:hypothetical protein [Marichromatium sp. AB32]|uniref:hypothetical protein n=1 Tax=Marichromatium sp. AB32 TaxID=2483363 RepID=UPI000F3EDB34|nr:hypothetical protein [Marichromatium sp. AB32]RNE93174.1 hypothetical protein EBL85_08055 [Marichromatium sp. AB32]
MDDPTAPIEHFSQLAPLLRHPLVLAGFALLLFFFGPGHALLKRGIIPPLPANTAGTILQRLLQYGFVLALVTIVFALALQLVRPDQQPWLYGFFPATLVIVLGFVLLLHKDRRTTAPVPFPKNRSSEK